MKSILWIAILVCGLTGGLVSAQEKTDDVSIPHPFNVYQIRVETEPQEPKSGEEVTFFVTGVFSSAGYVIQEKSLAIAKSLPEQILISLTIEPPTDEALTVVTPFREKVGSLLLTDGIHPVYVSVNGERVYESKLASGDTSDHLLLSFARSGGLTGWYSKFDLFQNGLVDYTYDPPREESPTKAVVVYETFVKLQEILKTIDFSTLKSDYLPESPYADGYEYVIYSDPYKVHISQGADLPDGLAELFPILELIMNRQEVIEPAGDPDPDGILLTFERSGGFAGWYAKFDLFQDGLVGYKYDPPQEASPTKAAVVFETFLTLQQLLKEIDFSTLQSEYAPETEYADGYRFAISYGGYKVYILQGAVLPDNLQAVFDILEKIMNREEVVEPAEDPELNEVLLTFERSGGFTGWFAKYVLYTQGLVEYTYDPPREESPVKGAVVYETFTKLQSLLKEIDFSTLQGEYAPETPYADGYEYGLSYNGFKIHISQGAELPENLQAVFDILEAIMNHQEIIEPSDDPVTNEVLLTFERSGGFTGWYGKFVLYPSGYVQYTYEPLRVKAPLFGKVKSEAFEKILALLKSIDFSTLPSEYAPDTEYADGYRYTISYNGYTIGILQGAVLPENLQTVLDMLEHILQQDEIVELGDESPTVLYDLRLEYEPALPLAYEPVELFVTGNFPTPGYFFKTKDVAILESYPEQISITLEVEIPTNPQDQVITPFRESLGTVSLSEGTHPVFCTVNGEKVDLSSITMINPKDMYPEGTWLGMIRSGGITGSQTLMYVMENRVVGIRPNHPIGSAEYQGYVPENLFKELVNSLNSLDFSTLEKSYQPDPLYADGYVYELDFASRHITIYQGAELPVDLEKVLTILTSVMDGQWDRTEDTGVTAVHEWVMY